MVWIPIICNSDISVGLSRHLEHKAVRTYPDLMIFLGLSVSRIDEVFLIQTIGKLGVIESNR